MREEFYQWTKNLAVFYILFTAVLHLVPDKKYERYIRSFMGLLLIYMLCTPVAAVLGKSAELLQSFSSNYRQEKNLLEQKESEDLQAFYLYQGYENELEEKIMESLDGTGIKIADAAVNIEGERVSVTIYVREKLTEEGERGIYDELRKNFGIEKEDCRILAEGNEETTVGGDPSSGASSGSDSGSRIGDRQPDQEE
ncbi:MAG TPA: stage III sporulation protein AF [Candidatus Blautia intestinavium]|nr:stage III sporulation protein AF [Candidatus Blautia intestinavium]